MKSTLSGEPALKTSNGKSYWVQNFYDAAGKRRQTSGATANAAKKAAMMRIEGDTDPVVDDCTFEEFSLRFITVSRTGRDGKEPLDHDTLRSYEGYLKNWINPQLGRFALTKITNSHMRDFLQHLLSNVPNRTTVQRILTITKVILGYAKAVEIIRTVPGADLTVAVDWNAAEDHKIERVPSADEMMRIEEAARRCYHSNEYNVAKAYKRYYPLFLLLRTTGMRFSECIGLKWDDFNLDMSMVAVRRRVSAPGKGKTEAQRIGRPKSKKGRRDVPVPASVKPVLLAWKKECTTDWLFATRSGNPMNYHNVRDKFWVPLLQRAGVDHYGMHSLRHFYASILMQKGLYKELSTLMGHHSSTFTMDQYGHLIRDDGDAMRRIGDLVSEGIDV
ncbi:integrase [Roseobacter phage DSS3P8]|nr:integrase [Roseobacter phage DSS3P8]